MNISNISDLSKKSKNILLFSFIILIPFQNTILGATPLRFLGRSPAFLFLFLFIIFYFICDLIVTKKMNKLYFLSFVFIIIINLFSFILYRNIHLYGYSLDQKGFNLFFLNFLLLSPLIIKEKYYRDISIKYAVFISLVICILGVLLGDYFKIDFIRYGIFQMSLDPFQRPRGFSYEPSMLSVTLIPLYMYYVSIYNKKLSVLNIAILIFLSLFIQSKGALVCLSISLFMTLCSRKNKLSLKNIFFVLLILISCIFIIYISTVLITKDMTAGTSVTTRLGLSLVAFFSIYHHPIGVGFPGFLKAFDLYVPDIIHIMNYYIPIKLNFHEIVSYGIAQNRNVPIGTKSFILNNTICLGIPFLITSFYLLYNSIILCRKFNRKDLELICWFLFLSLAFFVEGVGIYTFSLGFIVFKNQIYKEKLKSTLSIDKGHYDIY